MIGRQQAMKKWTCFYGVRRVVTLGALAIGLLFAATGCPPTDEDGYQVTEFRILAADGIPTGLDQR
jgi:hypothetical protein